jgi:hypothetical protein
VLTAGNAACRRPEEKKVTNLVDELRQHLDRAPDSGVGAVKGTVEDLRGRGGKPDRFAEALPLAEQLASQLGSDNLRSNATHLVAELYAQTMPPPTPMAVQFSPQYVPGTVERDEALRRAHESKMVASLSKLLADGSAAVKEAAARELLKRLDDARLEPLRPSLAPLAPVFAARADADPDAARDLLRIEGGARAATWLQKIAAGGKAPLPEADLSNAVIAHPSPDAAAPIATLLAADPAMRPGFHAAGTKALIAGVSGDPSVDRARRLFTALAAIDPAKAKAALDAAGDGIRPTLTQAFRDEEVQRLATARADELPSLRTQWTPFSQALAAAAAQNPDAITARAWGRLSGKSVMLPWLQDLAAGKLVPVSAADLGEYFAHEPLPDAVPALEKVYRAANARVAAAPATAWLEGDGIEQVLRAIAKVDASKAKSLVGEAAPAVAERARGAL